MITANPKTYVVTVRPDSSEGFVREPIIGWSPNPDNSRFLDPVTTHGPQTLGVDNGVLFSCGMVSCALGDLSYSSTEEWLEAGPHTGKAKAPAGKRAPVAAKEVLTEDDGEGSTEETGSAYDITWSGKSFKSNSWWHYDDGEYEFVFQIDGGEEVPKATSKCNKIKRDDFQSMKKDLDVLTVDEIAGADPLPVSEDEDELDDEADDLI